MNNTMNQTHHGCPFDGNADLYGLGIRLGIYFQMVTIQLSGLLSYALGSEDIAAEAAVVFVVSVGIVLVRSIVRHQVSAIEVVPIMTLLIALVNSYRNVNSLKTLAQVVYAAELIGLIGLAVWFWWYGMDTLDRGCYDKTFFFAKVSIWHWFRTFNKVLTVFSALGGLLYAGVFLLGFSWLAVMNVLKFFSFIRGDVESLEVGRTSATNAGFTGAEFLVNIGVIVFVEMTLKWNHIHGVHSLNSPGQFMPFFIGLAQLLAVLYKGVSNGLKRMANEDDAESFEDESDLECEHDRGHRRRRHYSSAWPGARDDVELRNMQR